MEYTPVEGKRMKCTKRPTGENSNHFLSGYENDGQKGRFRLSLQGMNLNFTDNYETKLIVLPVHFFVHF